MRRFAKVFAARKRDDKQPAVAPSRSVSSTASTPTDPTHSSGSSSGSASVCLQTPDDEHHVHLVRTDTQRSWKSWLGGKRTVTAKQALLPTQVRIERPPIPDWHSQPLPAPFLHPAPTKSPPLPVPPDDSDEDSSDHGDSEAHSFSPPASPAMPILPPSPGRARDNLRLITNNGLTPPHPVSPFIQHSNALVFPRSSNRSSLLPRLPSIRVNLLKKQLLSSLDTLDPSSPNMAAVMPFASKHTPSPAQPPHSSFPDIAWPSPDMKIFSSSHGVRTWVTRPCFEERNLIYLPIENDCRPVSSLLPVAALEYSEYLDVMADPDFDSSPSQPKDVVFDAWSPTEPTIPAAESHARTLDTATTPAPTHSRNSYTSVPSPLRNEHTPSSPKEAPTNPKPARRRSVKRVVRFAEDDSDGDDGLPLHIVRMKKMREQKAKFLQQERLKRTKEEEEERRRKEHEASERERKRLAMEKERKEREKALYADAFTASRMRAETTRAGGVPSLNASTSANLLRPSPSFASLKDSERNRPPESRMYSARLPHDSLPVPALPRREASDSAVPSSYYYYPSDSSPPSSRSPSISHSPVSPSYSLHSRPPSTYSAHTSSSEDMRQQSGSRRNSTTIPTGAMGMGMGVPSMYGLPPMIMSYPMWSGSNPNVQYIPPVPVFPNFVQDMPLLPPAAPFMKQPYERRSSRQSSPGRSLSSESRRGSFNSSTERVNAIPGSMSRTSSGQHLSASAGPRKSDPTPSRPTHSRRGSGDSRGTSFTQHSAAPSNQSSSRLPATSSRSQPALSRGRPPHPAKSSTLPPPLSPSSQFLQAPSPWTALPSQTGRVPTAVPVSPYSHNLNSPPRNGGGGSTGSGWGQPVIS